MDREKVFYEAHKIKIVTLEKWCYVLNSSLEANRSCYGEANVEKWD